MNTNKNMLSKLHLKEISEEFFIKNYSVPPDMHEAHSVDLLNNLFVEQKPEDVENVICFIIQFKLYNSNFISCLCKLITMNWHYFHENIANLLQGFRDVNSVDTLFEVINIAHSFDSTQYDDGYALVNKCLWALGDINTEASKEKLKELSLIDIPERPWIQEGAKHQLQREI